MYACLRTDLWNVVTLSVVLRSRLQGPGRPSPVSHRSLLHCPGQVQVRGLSDAQDAGESGCCAERGAPASHTTVL